MKKVSVIIPMYNQEKLIIDALESIPKRDDIETIVIDDKSTDKSIESVAKYIYSNPNKDIKLLYNSENKGVGYTVNVGYEFAKGEYMVLLGSDDYFITDEFLKCIKELDGTDLVYFDLRINNGDVFELNEETKLKYCGSVKFMRREFIGETRCPEIRDSEDFEFYKKLMDKKPTEKFTNIVTKHYNYPRENSLSNIKEKRANE